MILFLLHFPLTISPSSPTSIHTYNKTITYNNQTGLIDRVEIGNTELLANPVTFTVLTQSNQDETVNVVELKAIGPIEVTLVSNSCISYNSNQMSSSGLLVTTQVSIWFDSFIDVTVNLTNTASTSIQLVDLQLSLSLPSSVALYAMGFNQSASSFSSSVFSPFHHWEWTDGYGDNMIWFGAVRAGIRLKLKRTQSKRWMGITTQYIQFNYGKK